MNAIAAMNEKRVLGANGSIPWRVPLDFKWFKHKTMGGTLVMGRKTWESIGQKPLPGRDVMILSRRHTEGLTISSVDPNTSAHMWFGGWADVQHDSQNWARQPLWVCGGAQIYTQLLPQCHYLYLTRIKNNTIDGDTFMPDFESDFSLDQVIYENDDIRVERWLNDNFNHSYAEKLVEEWPFSS